jgi:hypothetical protein
MRTTKSVLYRTMSFCFKGPNQAISLEFQLIKLSDPDLTDEIGREGV